MTAAERQRLAEHLDGFDLQLADLVRSDQVDIRMGTFIQAAAFIDALALAYTWQLSTKVKGGDEAKWRLFVEECFSADHAAVADHYVGFRCLLLHNFSASPDLAFTSDQPSRHLQHESSGRLVLDRGSFVAATEQAFQTFRQKVDADDALAARVLSWLDLSPPIAYWTPEPAAGSAPPALSAASFATSGTSVVISGATGASASATPAGITGMNRSPDRPYRPMAPSVKSKGLSR
jgi:hypothetical protein